MGKTEKLEIIIQQNKAEKINTICLPINTNVLKCVSIYIYFFSTNRVGFSCK